MLAAAAAMMLMLDEHVIQGHSDADASQHCSSCQADTDSSLLQLCSRAADLKAVQTFTHTHRGGEPALNSLLAAQTTHCCQIA